MPISHVRGPGLLARVLLASLTFTLPAACGIDDVIITPGDPCEPGNGVDAGPVPDPDPDPDPEPDPGNRQSIYYDLYTFATEIQPALDASGCARSPCHSPETPTDYLRLFPNPAPGSIEMWSNLQAVTSRVQLDSVPFFAADTLLYQRAIDRHLGEPLNEPDLLLAWIGDAAARFQEDGGGNADLFDSDVFASDIQPMLDAGCALAGCHTIDTPLGGFGLHVAPAANTSEMAANLREVASLIDISLERAEDTLVYERAIDRHGGIVIEQPALLQAWIQAGLDTDSGE